MGCSESTKEGQIHNSLLTSNNLLYCTLQGISDPLFCGSGIDHSIVSNGVV